MQPEIRRAEVHAKAWGRELWIHNSEKYCGKILQFNQGAQFSMHFHVLKEETWYVARGNFILRFFDTDTAEKISVSLTEGDVIHLRPGVPHQLNCISDFGEVFEVSTRHFENDSYRIGKGDSQAAKQG